MQAAKRRTAIYVDGYNWYHAIFKRKPEWKWLNIQGFFEALRIDEDVVAVKFFTAIVDETDHSSLARARQQTYLKALRTLKKVRIILGKFQGREVTCRGSCKEKYVVPEEKKTDVNIAIEIITDALSGQIDSICIVSGDSDVQPVVEWVKTHRPHVKITVYIPALQNEQPVRRLDYYKAINVTARFLPLTDIANYQVPHAVKLDGPQFACRPDTWCEPKTSV